MAANGVSSATLRSIFAREPKFMRLNDIHAWESLGKRMGVSEVARSKAGFMGAYRAAGGDPARLSEYWRNRRWNFIKRHAAQAHANGESLFDEKTGMPTRRHLALIFWAYSPAAR